MFLKFKCDECEVISGIVVDTQKMDSFRRKTSPCIFENKSSLNDVVRFDLVSNVNDIQVCILLKQSPLENGNGMIILTIIRR